MPNAPATVRDAVAEREDEAAGKPPPLIRVVTNALQDPSTTARFQAVLPRGFDFARFQNLVLTAVRSKTQLIECFATEAGKVSLLLAVLQSATLGLEPDTPLQEAWLLPRKIKGVQQCQLSVGYVGLIKLARRSGEVKTIYAEVVHEADDFTWRLGTDPTIEHVPAEGDRGKLTHAYAVVRYKDDGFNFVVLSEADVHLRRAQSDSWKQDQKNGTNYSPWSQHADAMWRKSAVRALRPYLPLTAQVAQVMDRDEALIAFTDDGTLGPITDAEEVATVEAIAS